MSSEPSGHADKDRELLSQVFHLISQPMTALQCSLEFALNALEDPEQLRIWVEAALENSERLRCRLSLARELADADDGATAADTVDLQSVLQEVLEELQPLFETTGGLPQLRCEQIEVAGEHSRLLRAFVYLLEHLCACNGSTSYMPMVSVEREAEWVIVRFLRFMLRSDSNAGHRTSQLEIARKTLESAGGSLIFFCFAKNDAFVRVFLRPAHLQMALYGDGVAKKSGNSAIGTKPALPQLS